MRPILRRTLPRESQNSASPYHLTAKTLRALMAAVSVSVGVGETSSGRTWTYVYRARTITFIAATGIALVQ